MLRDEMNPTQGFLSRRGSFLDIINMPGLLNDLDVILLENRFHKICQIILFERKSESTLDLYLLYVLIYYWPQYTMQMYFIERLSVD